MSYTICSRFKGEHIVYAGYTICTSREHIVYGAFCGSTMRSHYHCHWTGSFHSMISYITLQYEPLYSKTCLKQQLKNRQNKDLNDKWYSLMKVESFAECSFGTFCNTFDLHLAIIGLETNFWSSL